MALPQTIHCLMKTKVKNQRMYLLTQATAVSAVCWFCAASRTFLWLGWRCCWSSRGRGRHKREHVRRVARCKRTRP
jgi:hypothetical protein